MMGLMGMELQFPGVLKKDARLRAFAEAASRVAMTKSAASFLFIRAL
jgi:hypothetical protein